VHQDHAGCNAFYCSAAVPFHEKTLEGLSGYQANSAGVSLAFLAGG